MAHLVSDATSQVEADHVRLKALIAGLADYLAQDVSAREFAQWKLAFLWRLRDFQSQLLKHFDVEEEGDFIDDLIRLAPQWLNRIEHVVDEHADIKVQLSSIIGDLKSADTLAQARATRYDERLHSLFSFIDAHERAECKLIQMAHNQVYGVGD